VIQEWYVFAWLVFIVCAAAYGLLLLTLGDDLNVKMTFFLGFLGFRNLYEIIVRARYSAIFAQSRVYRPVTLILLLETVGVILGFVFLFIFNLPEITLVNIAVFSLVFLFINLKYINNGYKALGLSTPKISFKKLRYFRFPSGLNNMVAWNHMAYMLTQKSSSVFIVLILYGSLEGSLPTVFHLLSPLMTASTNWIHNFYFDFRRFRFSTFQGAMRVYYRPLLLVALVVGGVAAVMSIIALKFLMTWQLQVIYLPIAAFICLRAITSSAFFIKFEQVVIGISILYFVISVMLPSVVVIGSDLGDTKTLLVLIFAQLIALVFVLLVKDRFLTSQPSPGFVTYSAKQYDDLRLKIKDAADEFRGMIDSSLVKPSRFVYFLRQSLNFLSLFLDPRSGRFFLMIKKGRSISELALSMQGDVLALYKAGERDWEVFHADIANRFKGRKAHEFECEIYPWPREAIVKRGAIVDWPVMAEKVSGHTPQRELPDLSGLTCRELYLAAKRSAIYGKRVRICTKKGWRLYLVSATDSGGVITEVRLLGEPGT
jgi:hypothetical protein